MSSLQRLNRSVWFWVRTHRRIYLALILAVLILQGFAVYGRLTSTTEFTSNDAVSEFRERQAAAAAASPQPTVQAPTAPTAGPTAPAGPAPAAGPAQPAAQPAANPAAQQGQGCDWVCATEFSPPQNGVYDYFQCGRTSGSCTGDPSEPQGTESFGGQVSRPFPRTGRRIISTIGDRKWTNTHHYSQEHSEEFELSVDETGVYNSRYAVHVKVGPVGGDSDIRQQPPFKLMSWPPGEGVAWNGSWHDTNREGDGDYSCQISGRAEIAVSGRNIRTWIVDCDMVLKGPKTSGKVHLKLWMSPELRNTVQEHYDEELETPNGPYKGSWMVTLRNATPRT